MASAIWSDLVGLLRGIVQFGIGGPKLKNNSGSLNARNAGDTADAKIIASEMDVSGDQLVLNSDAAETGADWKLPIARPASGMTADWTLTLPPNPGTAGYGLQTNGAGVTTWVAAGSTAACETVDTTTLAFGSSSPVAMFTLPVNAVINYVRVTIDTPFNGTPTASVGVSGTTSKYMGSGDMDLTAAAGTVFEVHPGQAPDSSSEALIITYAAGGASAGSARFEVSFDVPS